MMSGNNYKIFFSKEAVKDKKKLYSANLEDTTKKILNLMLVDSFCYPPSYEKLTGKLYGLYSRKINRQHRIVYSVDESKKEIHVYRMWTHYE